MKHLHLFVDSQADLDRIDQLLVVGYVVEKMHSLDATAIFSLVLPEEDDPEEKRGEFSDVTSIISVAIEEADKYLAEGYTLLDHYAKTVTLIKRKEATINAV